MKFASNCTRLATALSAAYRTYQDFQPGSTVEHFLDENGILLTMCMRYRGVIPWLECARAKDDSKLSASWVQADKTKGFRVIGKPIDVGPAVGLVLKPSAASIRCMYPADAGTAARDNNGCGPLSTDPWYGSKGYDHASWFRRALTRAEIVGYKNDMFGTNRSWDSIPCSEYFLPEVANHSNSVNISLPVIGLMEEPEQYFDDNTMYEWKYLGYFQYAVEERTHIMGFSVCNTSQPAPGPDFGISSKPGQMIYYGHQWWNASREDWLSVVDLMEDSLVQHPTLDVWNELVLDVPPVYSDFVDQVVQAVFYISGYGLVADEIARRLAKREARKMSKPLIYVKLGDDEVGKDLFHCPSKQDMEEEDNDDEETTEEDDGAEPELVQNNWLRKSLTAPIAT